MRVLNQTEVKSIPGGVFLQCLAALVAVIAFPKFIKDHNKEYNEWGHAIGEAAWEWNHPYDPNKK